MSSRREVLVIRLNGSVVWAGTLKPRATIRIGTSPRCDVHTTGVGRADFELELRTDDGQQYELVDRTADPNATVLNSRPRWGRTRVETNTSVSGLGGEFFLYFEFIDAKAWLARVAQKPEHHAALPWVTTLRGNPKHLEVLYRAALDNGGRAIDLASALPEGGVEPFLAALGDRDVVLRLLAEHALDGGPDALFRFKRLVNGYVELRDAPDVLRCAGRDDVRAVALVLAGGALEPDLAARVATVLGTAKP